MVIIFIRFMLVSFNDFGREINLNVQIEVTLSCLYLKLHFNLIAVQIDTPDVELFGAKIAGLKFESYNGGRDSKERLTQVKTILCFLFSKICMPVGVVSSFTECLTQNINSGVH